MTLLKVLDIWNIKFEFVSASNRSTCTLFAICPLSEMQPPKQAVDPLL